MRELMAGALLASWAGGAAVGAAAGATGATRSGAGAPVVLASTSVSGTLAVARVF